MRQLIAWELQQRKGYLFWWIVITIGIVLLLLSIYPSIHHQADQINKVLNQLPASLRDIKSGGNQVDITSPIGYLHSQLFYFTLPLLQTIMAIGLGSSLLAREEQNHTLELLLSRPLSRGTLLAAKAISGIMLVSVTALCASLTLILLSKLVGISIATTHLLLTCLYELLFSLSFGAIAFVCCAAGATTRRVSIALSAAIIFGGYLLTSLSSQSHYLQTPAKFFPYHYYNPAELLQGHLSTGLNIYLIVIAIAAIAISWLSFNHRDIV